MANGLLDFLGTPQGAGLLSGVASYAMNARRGTPVNNIGRGLAGGLMGYSQSQEDILRKQQLEETKQMRDLQMEQSRMQMQKMQGDMQTAAAAKDWKTGLPGVIAQARPKIEEFKPDTFDQSDNPFGQMANVQPGNPQALQDYLMKAESPFADKIMENQLFPKAPDYKTVGNTLLQVGSEGVKPVYTAAEKDKLPWYVKQDEQGKTQYDQAYLTNQERLNRAGASKQSVTNIMPKADAKYVENRMSDQAEYMKTLGKSAEGAYKSNQSLDRFIAASAKSPQGGAQPVISGVQNFLSSFGYSSESLTSTRQMEQVIGDILGNKMAELGARGLTDKDMEILRMSLPRVAIDHSSRVSVAEILKKVNNNSLNEYDNARQDELRQYPELENRIPEPVWYRSYKGAKPGLGMPPPGAVRRIK